MRIVDAKKRAERIYQKDYPLRLTRFSYKDITSLGSGELLFTGGISAICGSNGVGKSTILKAIYCGLTGSKNSDPRFGQPKLGSTISSRSLSNSNIEIDYSKDIEINLPEEIQVEIIDPSKSALALVTFFSSEKNLEEWKESVSPIEFSDKNLETISQLTGKKYDSLKIYELDDIEGIEENPLPYFEVTTSQKEYGTSTMGLGELVLLYIYWRLYRKDTETIILLEEPDTYVSYSSQEELFNIIAKFSEEKNLWVIMTTHSTAITSKVPLKYITLLYNHNGEAFFVQEPSLYQVVRMLGLPEKKNGLLLVEDDEAEELLKAIISILDLSILRQFVIINMESTGPIISSLKRVPQELGIKIIGVFDADMKENPDLAQNKIWPHIFLPGNEAPENLLMEIANNYHEHFANELSRGSHDLRAILADVEANEHHNWLDKLCENLLVDKSLLIYTLMKVWLETDEGKTQLSGFIRELQEYTKQ